jgi:hypothetical protein
MMCLLQLLTCVNWSQQAFALGECFLFAAADSNGSSSIKVLAICFK